jgi:hypothetical protein
MKMLAPKAANNVAINSSIGSPRLVPPPRYQGSAHKRLAFHDGIVIPAKWFQCTGRLEDNSAVLQPRPFPECTIGIVIDFSRALISDQRTG